MTANAPDTSSTQQLFKRRYDTDVIKVIPQYSVLRQGMDFKADAKLGEDFMFAMMVQYPHGHTWQGGDRYGRVVNMNAAVNGRTINGRVTTCSHTLREQLSWDLLSGSASKEQAFTRAADLLVTATVDSANWALELALMHGGGGIGTVLTNTPTSGTQAEIVVTLASWAPANFTAFEGGYVDFYDSTLATKQNIEGPVRIVAVDVSARTLTVEFAGAVDLAAIVATDVMVPFGAYDNWQTGLLRALTLSSAGSTVYGINTSLYGLTQASTINVGGALSFTKISQAAAQLVAKGGQGDFICLVSPWAWTDINNQEAANRRYISDGGNFVNGGDKLVFMGPNGGTLTVMQHCMMPAGNAVLLDFDDWHRVGTSDPTFDIPGAGNLSVPMQLVPLPDQTGLQFVRYWNQAPYCERLARQCLLTGIVNTSLPT